MVPCSRPTRRSASRFAGPRRAWTPTATRSRPRWSKIVEEALGGEYTVTVNPYPSTTVAMKAAMDGNGEIGYTADIGMTRALRRRRRASRTTSRPRRSWCTPGTPIRWNRSWRCRLTKAAISSAGRISAASRCSSRTAGFMNWLNFQRIYKALGYDFKHVQIDPKTQSDALQARHRSSARSPTPRQAARSRPTGRRPRSAWTSGSSIRARMRSPS